VLDHPTLAVSERRNSMSNEATSGQESGGRIDLEVTVYENSVVNVYRPESTRAHSIILDVLGDVVCYSCKGHKFSGECSHADATEIWSLVVASALAAATYHGPAGPDSTADTDAPRAVAGGGRMKSVESTESELPTIVDCDDDPHRDRCEGCDATGPKGLGDSGPAILHERGCAHAEDGR
jgi:hypothetical protein